MNNLTKEQINRIKEISSIHQKAVSPIMSNYEKPDFSTNYNKAMEDLDLKNKLDSLYKAPSDYNPDDLTFKDKVSAIGRVSNMTYAFTLRQESMIKDIGNEILSKYNGRKFNEEEVTKEVVKSTLTNFSQFLSDNPVTSWEDFERKKIYYKNYLKDLNIATNSISHWISIPAMITINIFDIYTLFILILIFSTPLKNYILILFQDLSINGKIRITIFSIGTGIVYGAIFSYLHKAITWVKVSNHLEYSMFLGSITFCIIAIVYILSLIKRQKENITEQYNTIFIKKMLSYNTNLENKIYNQNSATQSEHTAIIVFLIGFFGYLYFSKGG